MSSTPFVKFKQDLGDNKFALNTAGYGVTEAGIWVPIKVTDAGVQEVRQSGTNVEVVRLINQKEVRDTEAFNLVGTTGSLLTPEEFQAKIRRYARWDLLIYDTHRLDGADPLKYRFRPAFGDYGPMIYGNDRICYTLSRFNIGPATHSVVLEWDGYAGVSSDVHPAYLPGTLTFSTLLRHCGWKFYKNGVLQESVVPADKESAMNSLYTATLLGDGILWQYMSVPTRGSLSVDLVGWIK